ncbi:nitrate/nitrite transporter NrtS [Roseibacillus ishigakijimensis]|uniref:Nitrate/nitrite transporter NrtS n=1 Tax=Roseibacillus ishigakijimensis TaxID=454146 RepID=A0A934RP59_9BACT|nr:nitrate/nitrite transporter NrtS [Roseibacillus ishigakijimensis]MBK1834959.1 nitrate/nitrite transporter NrtS [Roseibacillus ishigakijimensis]
MLLFLRLASDPAILKRAFVLALLVGTILNLINQGEAMLAGAWGDIAWTKFLLTYCVPFCVSTYSATSAKIRFDPGTRAYLATRLKCVNCGVTEIAVEEGDLIPPCPHCQEKTDFRKAS